MARTVPTTEPTSARAGDTWEWKRTLDDFPAGTWTLTYTLFNSTAVETITASADGTTHVVDVAPTTTQTYAAGRYDWIAQVTDGTDIYTVGKSVIEVLPDLSSQTSYDGRSHARKMLDLINAVLESKATSDEIAIVRADIAARGVQYDIPGLIKLRQQYAAAVQSEDDAIALANGQQTGRFIQTRFVG